eukprot:SAG25_NODE_11433_length_304_cov_1.258537_1_plen_73_part_01
MDTRWWRDRYVPVTRTPELQRWVEQLLEQAAASPVLLDGRQRRDDEVIWRPVEPLVAGRGRRRRLLPYIALAQ